MAAWRLAPNAPRRCNYSRLHQVFSVTSASLIASDGLSLSVPLSQSRHISGELMRRLWLAWLVLISPECVRTDGTVPDSHRWSVTFNFSHESRWRDDFQVAYLQDSHYSINSLPISFVIQLTRCCSAASLIAYVSRPCPSSHSADLSHSSCKLWTLLEAVTASVYSLGL